MTHSPPTQIETFHIPALHCPEETALIEKGLRQLPGVVSLCSNYAYRELQIEFDPTELDRNTIAQHLAEIGFSGERRGDEDLPSEPARFVPRTSTIVGGLLLAAGTAAFFLVGPRASVTLAFLIASTMISGRFVVFSALRALRLRALDMNVLMSVAAVGAIATGNEIEAATAMFLFGVSLWLESYSTRRAHRSLQSLLELTPTVAHRIDGDDPSGDLLSSLEFQDVSPKQLVVADRLLVKPGERIAVDAIVLRGNSAVNQAPITGESLPVDKTSGDRVFAGTLNGEGPLLIEATETAAQSRLAQIGRLVRQAQSSRAPTERFVDAFAKRYTPAVLLLAAIIGLGPGFLTAAGVNWGWLTSVEPAGWWHRGLVLLVIACPCALVISTPLTIVCGLYQGTRLGLLIKGGERLESAGRIDALFFDKTGTLTLGRPRVVRIAPCGRRAENEVLLIAAALEHQSDHPLAEAITHEAISRSLEIPVAIEVAALRGLGIEGRIDAVQCHVGSRKLFENDMRPTNPAVLQQRPSDDSVMIVWVSQNHEIIGAIELSDAPRDDAVETIARLKRLKIENIAILTGDRRPVAESIAAEVGISQVFADLLPEEKVEVVRQQAREFGNVAMVGDGVNDAPALAAAHLGIAMSREASATAAETAGVLVTSPRLGRIVDLIILGRRCRRLLTENIALALAMKAIILVLASLGLATMWMAVAADVGASMLVIFNGMRIIDRREGRF